MIMLLQKTNYLIFICIFVKYSLEDDNNNDQREWSVDQNGTRCERIGTSGNQTCINDAYGKIIICIFI